MVEAERGYLIVASNTDDTDYIACARVLAKVYVIGIRWQRYVC